jgi:hypothetical protein
MRSTSRIGVIYQSRFVLKRTKAGEKDYSRLGDQDDIPKYQPR